MDFGNDHVFGCGTPYRKERFRLGFEIECLNQYRQMLALYLEKAGVSHRQYLLLWAMRYGGTKTVANLASIARVDQATAMDDMQTLERDGVVTLEAPPTTFETPQAERTDRYQDVRRALKPVEVQLVYIMSRLAPDPSHPWQGPPPRV